MLGSDPERIGTIARKLVTFVNTAADVDLFTTTGDIKVRLTAICKTSLTSAGGCNVKVGYAGVDDFFIPLTDCTLIDTDEIWYNAAPGFPVELASVSPWVTISNGQDIVFDIEAAKQVDAGVIQFYLEWIPLSEGAGSNVVAA